MTLNDNLRITKRWKTGYRSFSEFTSFHGFSELYNTKSIFWKTFWIICIGCAFTITSYQVYGTIEDYINQESTTLIQPAKSYQIIYPPIKLCYTHWVYWVDFEKGYKMKFSKEAILFGLSYIDKIYSITSINISDARERFTETLEMNKMKTLSEFYKSIAKFAPLRRFGDEYFDRNYSVIGGPYFSSMELMKYTMNKIDIILLCFVQDGKEIMNYIAERKKSNPSFTSNNVLDFGIVDERYMNISSDIANEEYNSYMAEFIQLKTTQYQIFDKDFTNLKNNYTSFFAPMIIFPDGSTSVSSSVGVQITGDIDNYSFNIRASAHKWKSTGQNPCNISLRSIVSDLSCSNKACADNYFYGPLNRSTFFKLHIIGKDQPQNMYRYDIYFIKKTANDSSNFTVVPNLITNSSLTSTRVVFATPSAANFTPPPPPPEQHKNCTDKCLIGCERWNFEVTVSSSSIYSSTTSLALKKSTSIKFVYPMDGDILMMTEVDSQTWENFVGNVGGLLGIWTGASIISFIQMFYLCFCAQCTCCKYCQLRKDRRIAKTALEKKLPTHVISLA